MNTTRIYVVRHGKTIFNAMDRVQGVCNAPLIDSGKAEIAAIGKRFAKRNWKIGATYHSYLGRTQETLDILKSELGLGMNSAIVHGIEEWNFGSFEGFENARWLFLEVLPRVVGKEKLEDMTCDEIANAFHEIDTLKIAPTWDELRERILNGFIEVARDCRAKGVNGLAVSHGMTMFALHYILTGDTLVSGSIKNGGLMELSFDGESLAVTSLEPNILGLN